jgi:hypothetical protein
MRELDKTVNRWVFESGGMPRTPNAGARFEDPFRRHHHNRDIPGAAC